LGFTFSQVKVDYPDGYYRNDFDVYEDLIEAKNGEMFNKNSGSFGNQRNLSLPRAVNKNNFSNYGCTQWFEHSNVNLEELNEFQLQNNLNSSLLNSCLSTSLPFERDPSSHNPFFVSTLSFQQPCKEQISKTNSSFLNQDTSQPVIPLLNGFNIYKQNLGSFTNFTVPLSHEREFILPLEFKEQTVTELNTFNGSRANQSFYESFNNGYKQLNPLTFPCTSQLMEFPYNVNFTPNLSYSNPPQNFYGSNPVSLLTTNHFMQEKILVEQTCNLLKINLHQPIELIFNSITEARQKLINLKESKSFNGPNLQELIIHCDHCICYFLEQLGRKPAMPGIAPSNKCLLRMSHYAPSLKTTKVKKLKKGRVRRRNNIVKSPQCLIELEHQKPQEPLPPTVSLKNPAVLLDVKLFLFLCCLFTH
jgi:hypothetical protein